MHMGFLKDRIKSAVAEKIFRGRTDISENLSESSRNVNHSFEERRQYLNACSGSAFV